MTRYAIDAAALVRIVSDPVDVAPAHRLVAPNRVRGDALTLLLGAVRTGELTDQQARSLHTRLTELKIRVLSDRVSRWTSYRLARDHGWDDTAAAEYLAVATLQADALVALDPTLAARADGLVTLAPLAVLSA